MASTVERGSPSAPRSGSIPRHRHSVAETDVLENIAGVAVPCATHHHLRTSSSSSAIGYGGTQTKTKCNTPKDSDDMVGGSGEIVVPVTTDRDRVTRPAADGEGECIVADSDASADDSKTCMGKVRHFLLNSDPLLYRLLKWGLAVLLLLFLIVLVAGMLFKGVMGGSDCKSATNTSLEGGMPGRCQTHFGTILGGFDNVYSYSNCNDDYVSTADAYLNLSIPVLNAATGMMTMTPAKFYSGLKWQCVEYARRYWMINGRPKPAYFGSVDWASDIWNLTEVHLIENTSKTLPLHRFKSGDRVVRDGLQPPQVGDIIIYPVQPGGFPVGHVAVITKVEVSAHGYINVAEQNWGSMQWRGPYHNFSRRIPLTYDHATTAITLNDPAGKIIGWMRYG